MLVVVLVINTLFTYWSNINSELTNTEMSSISSRSKRIMRLLDETTPKYESTKGTTSVEQKSALVYLTSHNIKYYSNLDVGDDGRLSKHENIPENKLLLETGSEKESDTSATVSLTSQNKKNVNPDVQANDRFSKIAILENKLLLEAIPEKESELQNNLSSEDEPFSPDHSEYIPDSASSSSDSDDEINQKKKNKEEKKFTNAVQTVLYPSPTSKSPCQSEFSEEKTSTAIARAEDEDLKVTKKKRVWVKVKRERNMCYFCETNVLNFARHLITNHKSEHEVQKLLSLPPKDIERKNLIADIRKRGNHLQNIDQCLKPVKKTHHTSDADYIPCKYCLGYYRPKQLWRHIKVKHSNVKDSASHQIESQNVLVRHLPVDKQLRETVFPRMRADQVSLAAKKDLLICKFGSRYLKTHREKHLISVCSRKMRELSKLLMEVKKLNPSIKNLYDALRPEYFDLFVESTKTVAHYDPIKEVFGSPTYAMNIQTSLKQCCDIAILFTIKRKQIECNVSTAEREANFKTFKQLLEDDWRYEISTIAAADLGTKKWNKVTILPLARDLKVFRNYLLKKSETAARNLEINEKDANSYQLLMETTFCRLILLNRKRVGEMERLPLHVYQEAGVYKGYEEFQDSITPTERILLTKVKRVVTRGKRGRGVPILFTNDLQQHTAILIKLRKNYFDDNLNIYLFPKLKTHNPITGYKILQKHARMSGAENPGALTSTRLRKHLATLTQIFNMAPSDIEQLATFMGHTNNIHNQVYRLPDDVYQTAKISKLLMLMERGEAAKYKGMSISEINIDLERDEDELSENENSEKDYEELLPLTSDNSIGTPNSLQYSTSRIKTNSPQPSTSRINTNKKPRVLIPWTSEQKQAAKDFFAMNIKKKVAPKKLDCVILKKDKFPMFENKTWPQIKVFIQNLYSKKYR